MRTPWSDEHIKGCAIAALYGLRHPLKKKFKCPICGYFGPFRDARPSTGVRLHAKCLRCGSLERHRLQRMVVDAVLGALDTTNMRMLHFAPESFFENTFRSKFGSYETADIEMDGVDHIVDLQSLPFDSGTYDLVYASHVLEHVRDDHAAIAEIRRILKPGGLAVLPVPLAGDTTIEYPTPNPLESMHVRAPGLDYFQRFLPHFREVVIYKSEMFPVECQPFLYVEFKDTTSRPELRPKSGQFVKISDVVPVCFA